MKNFLLLIFGLLSTFSVLSQVSLGLANIEDSQVPVDAYYGYSYSQTIYLASSIDASGDIDSICYKTLPGINLSNSSNWLVLIGHTPLSEFSGSWISANTLDTVFHGTISITNDTVFIPFDQAFSYTGNENIVVAVLEQQPGYDGSSDRFYCTSTPNPQSRYTSNDWNPIDPYSVEGGIQLNVFSDITFFGITQSCPTPSDLVIDSINHNSVAFSWNGNNSDFEVDFGEDGLPLGEGNVFSTLLDSVSVDTLLSATSYRIYVRQICGVGDTSGWLGPILFTTDCGFYTPDYLEEFTDFPPFCWEAKKGLISDSTNFESQGSFWYGDGFGNVGYSGSIRINLYSNVREWFMSPTIDLGDGSTSYQLSFDAALTDYAVTNSSSFASDDSVFVIISTDNGITWSDNNKLYEWYEGISLSNNGEQIIIDLSGYTDLVKIAFYAYSPIINNDIDFFIDNFLIQTKPSCSQPNDLLATNITYDEATLSWMGPDTVYFVEYGLLGFAQDTSNIINVNDDTLIVTNLLPNTEYEFYVSSYCTEDGDTSSWSGPYSFTTQCAPLVVPTAVQPFDVIAPDCWEEAVGLISDSTSLSFANSFWVMNSYGNQLEGSSSANFNIYMSRNGWLISPTIDLSGGQYQLEFDMVATNWGTTSSATIGADDTVRVVISTDNGITWSRQNSLDVWTSATGIPNTSTHQVYDLSSYSSLVKFAFYCESTQDGSTDFDLFIDNFKVNTCTQYLDLGDTIVCDNYTSPISGNVYTQTGTYTDTISNTTCDSIYSLNLIVNPITFSAATIIECDTLISVSGNAYTQTGVYFDTIPNMFACDSIVETNLSILYVDLTIDQSQNVFLQSNETDPAATYQWVNCSDLSPINGQTSAEFTATSLGDFACKVSIGNCTQISECISITSLDSSVSINQFIKSDIKVYPNPNNGQFTLELGKKPQGKLNLTISNTLGQIIHKQQLTRTTNTIDLANVEKGIYIMDLFSPTQSFKTRIVID